MTCKSGEGQSSCAERVGRELQLTSARMSRGIVKSIERSCFGF